MRSLIKLRSTRSAWIGGLTASAMSAFFTWLWEADSVLSRWLEILAVGVAVFIVIGSVQRTSVDQTHE